MITPLSFALLAAAAQAHGLGGTPLAFSHAPFGLHAASRAHGSSRDPAAARASIEAVLRDMTGSVLAGRAEEYLRHVWSGDANWRKEQENWAADLTRGKVPAVFEFRLKAGDLALADGWATAEVEMKWSMKGGEAGRGHALDYTARFVQGDAGEWRYAGEAWEELIGERVRVLFPAGYESAAEVIAEELPGVREKVHEGFELEEDDLVQRVQQVKLYASMEHLQQSIYLSYTDPLGGWNEPGEAIKLLASQVRRRGSARMLLAHEYGHVATFELGDLAPKMPWWTLEGAAELAAESVGGRSPDRLVRGWAESGDLIEWSRLSDFRGEAREHSAHVYKQGHHMLGFISERSGRSARNRWLAAMARGRSLDEATREILGVSFDELDAEWRASLRRDP